MDWLAEQRRREATEARLASLTAAITADVLAQNAHSDR